MKSLPGRRIKTKKGESISAGIVINIIAVTILKCFAVFTSPYITEVLDTDNYGNMSAYNTWAGIVCTIAGLGSASTLVNFKFSYGNDDYDKYCWNSLKLSSLAHFVCLGVCALFWKPIKEIIELPYEVIPLIVFSAFCQYVVNYYSAYLINESRALRNVVFSLISTIGGFALSVVFVVSRIFSGHDVFISFILGYTFVNFVLSIYILVYFWRGGAGKFNLKYASFAIKIGIPIVFHLLSATVLGSSDRLMIKGMIGAGESGTYSYAYNFANILYGVWSAINAIWMPFYFQSMKCDDQDMIEKRRKNFDVLYCCLVIGFLMVYPEVYKGIANERYWVTLDIVPIVVVAFVFNHIYSFSQGYESFKQRTTFIATGTILTAIVNVILNCILIPRYANYGAAIATVLSYILLYVFHKISAKYIIKKYPLSSYNDLPFMFVCILAVVLSYILFDMISFRWSIAVVVGVFMVARIIKNRTIL